MSTSLYERLGGAAGINALVDDIIAAHLENPLVGPRFKVIKDLDNAKSKAREFFAPDRADPSVIPAGTCAPPTRG